MREGAAHWIAARLAALAMTESDLANPLPIEGPIRSSPMVPPQDEGLGAQKTLGIAPSARPTIISMALLTIASALYAALDFIS